MAGEANLQTTIVKWMRLQYPDILFFAIPNEQLYSGKGGALAGKRLNDMGRMAGVADLFIAHPIACGMWGCGLFIECKSGRNKQSPAQRIFEQRATQSGYHYKVVYTIDEAIQTITHYIES